MVLVGSWVEETFATSGTGDCHWGEPKTGGGVRDAGVDTTKSKIGMRPIEVSGEVSQRGQGSRSVAASRVGPSCAESRRLPTMNCRVGAILGSTTTGARTVVAAWLQWLVSWTSRRVLLGVGLCCRFFAGARSRLGWQRRRGPTVSSRLNLEQLPCMQVWQARSENIYRGLSAGKLVGVFVVAAAPGFRLRPPRRRHRASLVGAVEAVELGGDGDVELDIKEEDGMSMTSRWRCWP
jgi:hypothetical protein